MSKGLFVVCCSLIVIGCGKDYQPKPKGYNRLVLPTEQYAPLPDTLPYRFEYSVHSKLLKDSSWIRENNWIEIYYPTLKSTIHITYKRIYNKEQLLKEYYNDSYKLTAKHQIKAYAIDETIVKSPSGKTAFISEIEGEVPSQFQFTMTDSSANFLRGALYFNVKVQNDSLKPAIDFMKKEVIHVINTMQWRR
jgi:gliding motility-associated lipoprotein GldD